MEAQGCGASSIRPDGRRPVWDLIWKNGAPAKVRVFAWSAARESLVTQATKNRMHMEQDPTCVLCGHAVEDVHHALVQCPHAVALWAAMRDYWDLPTIEDLCDAAPEWLFRLLDNLSDVQRLASLMIMWRIWYARNEITHNKPPVPIEASRRFLTSYITSLLAIQQHPEADLTKGKQVIDLSGSMPKSTHAITVAPRWEAPDANHAKLNIDGALSRKMARLGLA